MKNDDLLVDNCSTTWRKLENILLSEKSHKIFYMIQFILNV